MKRIIVGVVVGLFLVVGAQADLSVNFMISYGVVDQGTYGPLLADGEQALIQLIYAGADGLVDGPALFGGALAAGDDVILYEGLGPVAVAGDFTTEYGVFDSINVEAAGIAGGLLYGRIFQDDAAGIGSYYFEGPLAAMPNVDLSAVPSPLPTLYDLAPCCNNWIANLQLPGSPPPSVELTVFSSHGTPMPSIGTNTYYSNDTVICSVDSPVDENGTQYACSGWIGTGDIPATGSSNNTGNITLIQNSSISWNWATNNYWLDVNIVGNGTLNIADGWYPIGTNLNLVALPDDGWEFAGWTGDLSGDHTTSSTNLVLNSPMTVTAVFSNVFWHQVGVDIDGEAPGDWSGVSVSSSADGNRVAIGAPRNAGNGANSGHVRVFEFSGGSWIQLGADIDGETEGDESGMSVSLSADGNRIAIGAPRNDDNGSNAGHVRIFEFSGGSWIQLGADIDGEAAGDWSGVSVSLSANGTRVAIGAPFNDSITGQVRIYEFSGGSWTQLGADIDGEAAGDYSGYSVSLSSDGTRVAIGAAEGDDPGYVRIFEYSGGSWNQLGADIDGEASGDWYGWSVSLSADGARVAIGAIFNDGNGSASGHVRVLEYSGGSWNQLGADIDGEAAGDHSGMAVSLSSDGSIVAIGAEQNDGNGNNSGHVRLFEYSEGSWSQLGTDMDGEAAGDFSGGGYGGSVEPPGQGVSISADSSRIAIGAQLNDGNGANSGHVRIFELSEPTVDIEILGSGTVSPPSGRYERDTNLTLSATADAGWLFMGWSGDIIGDYTTAITNLLVDSSKTITATFSDDADADGLLNTNETALGTNPRNSDTDADGLSDGDEVNIYGTNPRNSDSDNDGLLDSWEVANSTDPTVNDSGDDPDNDGLTNAGEYAAGTSPTNPDSDGDGLPDGWEVDNGLNPLVGDSMSDADGDDLSALQEFDLGTDPNDSDSDDDLLSDLQELHLGTDPNDSDSDDDLLSDSEEVKNVVAWGDNYYKQTVVPSNVVNAVSVFAGGAHSLVLLADGQIITWGDNYYGQCDVPASVSNVISIAAGDAHSLAALSNGTVVAWGDNYYQQLTVPPDATNVVAVSAGVEHSMALRADGHVVVWGDNYYGVRDVPPTAVNAVAISAGGYHNLALLADGGVVAWGDNTYGACDVPAGITNAVGIAAGGYHSVALLADGSVVAWGQDDQGQASVPASASNAVSIAAGGYHSLALLTDQSVVHWGTTFYSIGTIPPKVQYPVDIAAGRFFSLALMSPTDPLDDDSDDDGLSDGDEVNIHATNPTDADTEGDGLPDGWEAENGLDPLINDAASDADADGLSALQEHALGTDPNNADSDADGLDDGLEVNTYFSSPLDPDCDADGLLDGEEVALGTGLFDSDSDDDGLLDGAEVNSHGTDPLDSDSDDDGLIDGEEVVAYTTDPLNGDTDGDTFGDGQEVANGGSPLVSDLWRIDHIRNHGSTYELYSADSVLDLSIGQAGFTVSNGTAWLSLQLQESTDLVTWTNAGDEVIWSIPVDLDKAFYRVRSGH